MCSVEEILSYFILT